MSREDTADEPISPEELTELLAEATGVTSEEIEQGVEIGPPDEATVVDED